MPTGVFIRVLTSATLILLLGWSGAAHATSNPAAPMYAMQDMNDDDGDGIPNYRDPHDNREDIVDDQDDAAAEPTPAGTSGSGGGQTTPPQQSTSPAAPVAVTALPDTGSGPISTIPAVSILLVGSVIFVLLAAANFRFSSRMQ